jgi:hypothetical protein
MARRTRRSKKAEAEDLGAQGTRLGHNLKARAEITNECAAGMRAIKAERQELNERAGDIRQRLKDAGISVEAFNYAQRIAEKDGEDRDAYMDAVHEQFMARGIGHQADLFKDPERGEGEKDDPRPNFLKEKTAAHDTETEQADATTH